MTTTATPAISTDFSQAAPARFSYGWSTVKNGTSPFNDRGHYLLDEPYATAAASMLERLGLPFPDKKDMFRGRRSELLFVNTHGVVVRIGPADIKKLMTPGVIQPLGWLEDKNLLVEGLPLTAAVYPGIRLIDDEFDAANKRKLTVDSFLSAAGQYNRDFIEENNGAIWIKDEDGKDMPVPVVLDADFDGIAANEKLTEERTKCMEKYGQIFDNAADVVSQTLREIFSKVKNADYWLQAFDAHQPLRQLFWTAFKNPEAPDVAARDRFWDTCSFTTQNPQQAIYPIWRMEVAEDGTHHFVRTETQLPKLELRTPWVKGNLKQKQPPMGPFMPLKFTGLPPDPAMNTPVQENNSPDPLSAGRKIANNMKSFLPH